MISPLTASKSFFIPKPALASGSHVFFRISTLCNECFGHHSYWQSDLIQPKGKKINCVRDLPSRAQKNSPNNPTVNIQSLWMSITESSELVAIADFGVIFI